MKKSTIVFYLLALMCGKVFAQEKEARQSFYPGAHSIGINVSDLLSNMLSLKNTTDNQPFGFQYVLYKKNVALRLGLSGLYDERKEFAFSLAARTLRDHSFGGRVGLEAMRNIIPNKLQLHYALDFFANNAHAESIISGSFLNSENTLSYGTGPALRLIFRINKRFIIGTESTAYFSRSDFKKIVQLNTPIPEVSKATSYNFKLSYPQSLYVNFVF